jgi:hypothetical protein
VTDRVCVCVFVYVHVFVLSVLCFKICLHAKVTFMYAYPRLEDVTAHRTRVYINTLGPQASCVGLVPQRILMVGSIIYKVE